MVSRSERIRLGLFLVVATSLLVAALAILSGARFLEDRDQYTVRFTGASVAGLEIGADVRYQGVRVGRVQDITIDTSDLQTVIVSLSLRSGTPIRVDTEATLQFQGITGLKMIELRAGDPLSPALESGSTIPASTTLVERMGERAERIADRLELVLEGLAGVVDADNRGTMESLLLTLHEAADSLGRASGRFRHLVDRTEGLTTSTQGLIAHADSILRSTDLTQTLSNLASASRDLDAANLDSLAGVATTALSEAERAFTHLDLVLVQSREDILRSTESLREGADHMNEFARLIAEDPSRILRGTSELEIDAPWEEEPR